MLRPQRNPSTHRLKEILRDGPSIAIDWGTSPRASVGWHEAAGVDRVQELLRQGAARLQESASGEEKRHADDALVALSQELGEQLRRLNQSRVFLMATRRQTPRTMEDPDTGTSYTALVPQVRLRVHRLAAAA